MFCKNCGYVIDGNSPFCSNCGQKPLLGSNYCHQCGHICIPGDLNCVNCNASLIDIDTMETPMPEPEAMEQFNITTQSGPKFLTEDTKYCRNCGLVIPKSSSECKFCEATQGSNYCQQCGSGTTNTDTVCSVCSTQLTRAVNVGRIPSAPPAPKPKYKTQPQPQSRQTQPRQPQPKRYQPKYETLKDEGNHEFKTALLLSLLSFFGLCGLQRLYTKHYVSGLFLLVTGGLCYIWQIIDIIMILTDSFTDGDGNHLRR